jgi:hypothetical protein
MLSDNENVLCFLLINTQEKPSWFSIHHVVRQGECFFPLLMVKTTKKKTVLGAVNLPRTALTLLENYM